MMFASKTPRDLNHDPRPLSTLGTGRRVRVGSEYAGETVLNPRPEYDHPQHNEPNRLLVDFRAIDAGRGEYARWLLDIDENPAFWELQPGHGLLWGVMVGYEAAHIDHARRVLTRLARFTEQETPA